MPPNGASEAAGDSAAAPAVPPAPQTGVGAPATAPAAPLERPSYPAPSPAPGGYDEAQPSYGYGRAEGVRIPTSVAARLRTLETDLNLLSARGGGRIADGVISLIAGGAFFTIAAFIDDPLFRSLLFMTAGVAVGRGVVELAVLPDPEDFAIEYGHMPMASVEQVRERLGYGESSLSLLAQRHRIARMLDGTLAMASGTITIAVFVARPPCYSGTPDCRFKDDPVNYVVIAGGGISIIGGLVSLVMKSEAERRWDAYEKLRERLDADRGVELSLPSFGPLRRGAAVHWGLRF